MRLFHFSDRGDIASFVPQPPERHPDTEPLVYAIDEWHQPLYFFPRNCPRIGVWPTLETSKEDRTMFEAATKSRMRQLIDQRFEDSWRNETLYRYEFNLKDGFIDCEDHGVWVSRQTVIPLSVEPMTDLPLWMGREGIQVEIVPSLAQAAREFFNFETRKSTTSLHVSMVRMSLLPDWQFESGKPATPKSV